MELSLKEKCVYGSELIYPDCEDSKTMSKLVGKKTFNDKDLNCFSDLGYKLFLDGKELRRWSQEFIKKEFII